MSFYPRRPGRLLLILGLAAAFVVLYSNRSAVLTAAARWLDVGEAPSPADYVMILPGGEETRPFVAAALVKQGWAEQSVIPQTAATPDVNAGLIPPSSEVIRRVLLNRGLDQSQIVTLPSASDSTWEDAAALGAFLRSRPATRAIVVTHHHHTRRAQWVFRQTLGRDAAQVVFVAAPTDGFSATNWWRAKAGIKAVLSEYCKFAWYLFRYGDLRAWSALAAVTIAAVAVAYRRVRRRRIKQTAATAARPQKLTEKFPLPLGEG
jgi:uncharacterized SAM-binding protein YcdF (DUF218 family)